MNEPIYRIERRDLLLLSLLVAVAILRGLLWIAIYPALKIADEPAHFDNIQYRSEHRLHRPIQKSEAIDKVLNGTASVELRRLWDASNYYWRGSFLPLRRYVPEEHELEERASSRPDRATEGQSTALGYPGFYYTLATIPYHLFTKSSILVRLFAVRVYSLLWGLVLVVCTYLASRFSVGHRPLSFAAGLFAVLQPMAAQQTVAVNNDAGLIGLCALAFLLQLLVLRRLAFTGFFVPAALGIVTACALETKPHAYGLLPGAVVLLVLTIHAAPRARRTWALVATGLAAYFIVRYGFATIFDRAAQHSGAAGTLTHDLPVPAGSGFVSFLLNIDDTFVEYLFTTGWGTFCWLDVAYASRWFDALHEAAPLLWLGIGSAVAQYLLQPGVRLFWNARLVAFSLFTACTGFTLVLYAEYFARVNMKLEHAVQGRAFLFVLPAVAVVAATAIGSLVPARLRTLAATVCVVGLMLLAAGAVVTVVRYQYAG